MQTYLSRSSLITIPREKAPIPCKSCLISVVACHNYPLHNLHCTFNWRSSHISMGFCGLWLNRVGTCSHTSSHALLPLPWMAVAGRCCGGENRLDMTELFREGEPVLLRQYTRWDAAAGREYRSSSAAVGNLFSKTEHFPWSTDRQFCLLINSLVFQSWYLRERTEPGRDPWSCLEL